jgi:hypothetical protein
MMLMNKSALKKTSWTHARIRPIAKRFYGADGPQLPPVDDDWLINEVGNVVRITNAATGHIAVLGLDQIHHYSTDPARGQRCGFLTLNVQLQIGGDSVWIEPTFRPGEALPDQFGNVRNWKRENDAEYIRSLFTNAPPMPVTLQAVTGTSAPGFGLIACIFIGVGLLITKG